MHVNDFISHLKDGGSKTAVASDAGTATYDALHEKILGYSRQLEARAISNKCVLLVDNYSVNSICMLFALWMRNNVVALSVPKEPGKIAHLASSAGASFFIIGDAANEFAFLPQEAGKLPPVVQQLVKRKAPGFVVFSSGSTGPAKGVVHEIKPFFERYLSADPCGPMLAFLLFDHIGGLVTALQALATHGTLVIPRERSPQEVGRCVEQFTVETLHVSPTLLNLAIISGVFQKWDTSSVRRIYYGSEPSSASVIERIRSALPQVELCQLYGMSEIGVLPCRSRPGDSSWMKVDHPNYSVKVVDGILHVRGATTMAGYMASAANLSDDNYLITEDLAEEHEGYFRVTGRAVDVINVGGKKVFPSDVERMLMNLANVADAVVYGEANPILGQIVAARVTLCEPEELGAFKTRLYQQARGVLSSEQLPRMISISDSPLHTTRFKKMRNPGIATPT